MEIRLLRLTLFMLTMSFSHLLYANETASELRSIHTLQLNLLEVASQFHRFQGSEGNKKFYFTISNQLDDVKKGLSNAEASLTRHNLAPEAQSIKDNTQQYLQNLNTALASIKNGGFADFSIIDNYLNAHDSMLKALDGAYIAISSSGGYKIPPLVIDLRNQALLMQAMYSKYIEVSSSQFGYTPRTGQENEETLDQMAARFTSSLKKLKTQIPVTSPLAPRLNEVQTKWLFLEKSFLNYNERTVPFLITKFGKQIITELSAIADGIESGN